MLISSIFSRVAQHTGACTGNSFVGSIFFCLSLNYKQMSLYMAPGESAACTRTNNTVCTSFLCHVHSVLFLSAEAVFRARQPPFAANSQARNHAWSCCDFNFRPPLAAILRVSRPRRDLWIVALAHCHTHVPFQSVRVVVTAV